MHTRLQAIQSAIALGDHDMLPLHADRLPPEAADLAAHLRAQQYPQAAEWIQTYLKTHHALAHWQDPHIAALRLKLEALEARIATLAEDIAEIERQIAAFNARLHEILGDTLLARMRHTAQQAQQAAEAAPQDDHKQQQAEQAQAEWQEFDKRHKQQPKVARLSEDEQAELKKLYRESAMKCHPDRLPRERQREGTALFQELQQANREQDLPKMREIWHRLNSGGDWRAASATLATQGDAEALRQRIAAAEARETALQHTLAALHQHDQWLIITKLQSENRPWDDYLHDYKARLEATLPATPD